jgi:hypothetical protein
VRARAALLALAAMAPATANAKKAPRPVDAKVPETPPPERIEVRIVEHGQMTDLRIVALRLQVTSTAGGVPRRRNLSPLERDRLAAAARAVLAADYSRRACGEDELFASVAVDGKSLFSALCPQNRPEWIAEWRRLIELARSLAVTVEAER